LEFVRLFFHEEDQSTPSKDPMKQMKELSNITLLIYRQRLPNVFAVIFLTFPKVVAPAPRIN